MAGVQAKLDPKWTTLRAKVFRANGTVEDRGVIAFRHRNPIINWVGQIYVRINYAIGEWRRTRRMAK